MQEPNPQVPKIFFLFFRSIFCVCTIFFFLMGLGMAAFPELITKNAGVQHPLILGMLRGSGGMIIGTTLFYIMVAIKPIERKWAAGIIAFGNILAIAMDLISVYLGEYQLTHAMIDIPIEMLSLLTIVLFYSIVKIKYGDAYERQKAT
jgi:hypothetical protein